MDRGFNLLELIVGCGIVASLSAMGFFALQEMSQQQALYSAGAFVQSALSKARFQAVAKNLAVELRVHPNKGEFTLIEKGDSPQLWRTLPEGVVFSRVPTRLPTFHSRGYASPSGTFILQNPSGQIRVIISVSGRVRWERIE